MNLKFNFLGLCALLIGCLVSCDKAADDVDVTRPETIATQEIEFALESDLQMDEEQARIVYDIGINTGYINSIWSAQDMLARFAVRRGNNGTPVVQEVDVVLKWEKGGTTKKHKYSFRGKLTVPAGTEPLQIAGLLMGEKDGEAYLTEVSKGVFRTVEGAETAVPYPTNRTRQVNLKIPHIAKWSPMTFDSAAGLYKSTMTFKPSGTLIRMRVLNDTDNPVTISTARILSDAYVSQWQYSFDRLTGNDLMEGHSINTYSKINWYPFNTTVGAAQVNNDRISPSTTPWKFIWVMPKSANGPFDTSVVLYDDKNKEIPVFSSTVKPALGYVALNLRLRKTGFASESCFPNGKIPLMYMAEYNLSRPKVFASSHSVAEADNYYIGPNTVPQTSTYVPDGYHLPSREEWLSVFPGNSDAPGYAPSHESVAHNSVQYLYDVPETIQVGGKKIEGYSDYNNMSIYGGYAGLSTYALRFKGKLENGKRDNCNLVAYRYRYLSKGRWANGTYESYNKYLEITCRYLGNSFKGDINTISNDEFWNANKEHDVVRHLPFSGQSEALIRQHKPSLGHVGHQGSGQHDKQFFYWTSTPGQYSYNPYKPTGGYWYVAGMDVALKVKVISEYFGGEQYCAVRLWKNN